MATFNELFPDDVQEPFAPIQPGRIRKRLSDIRSSVRTALPVTDDLNAGSGGFLQAFGDITSVAPQQPELEADTEFADLGKAAIGSIGGVGAAAAGAGEYLANLGAGTRSTPGQQTFGDLADTFAGGRRASNEFTQNFFESMTPEAQDRAAREVLSLDPNKTIFQGGAGEFLSSVALKIAGSAASTGATLLPGTLLMRAGLGRGAVTFLGASEGGLSLGSIAANIADEVEQAPEEELLQSERYKELRQQFGEGARQQLIKEAQGLAPVYGGILVGAISAAAGRYLEPVFTDDAAGALGRAARGFASEGIQEAGQSSAEQIAQNIAAKVFDADRGAFEGVPESIAQGALVGGVMGGGTAAALGGKPRRTAIPVQEPAPPATPAPAGAASFDEVFGPQKAPKGGFRGGDTEFQDYDRTDSPTERERVRDDTGQSLISIGAIDPALQAAANARRDGRIQDMFESQPAMTPQQEQQAYVQKPFPVTQTQMDLPQAVTDVVPSPQGEQLPLGLRERVRGTSPTTISPTSAAPLQQDMSVPPQFMSGAGTVRDENQQDLFAQDPPLNPDEPSAEPVSDLLAQIDDLQDPDSQRTGVYLSAANIAALRDAGTFEQVRGAGVPLANFDGKGGTLIAKDRQSANELLGLRDSGAGSMQELLGFATGAGAGKPLGADIAVQQRDPEGNVVRESLVASPEEADALAQSFDQPDREGVVLSAGMAIKRRAQKLREEARGAEAQRDIKSTRRRADQIIEEEFDEETADKVKKKIGRKSLSENEAARKLVGYSARLRKQELKKRLGDVDVPESLEFKDLKSALEYEELFGQYRDSELSELMSRTADSNYAAKSKREALRRQIGALRLTNKATTRSEKVARVARRISQEEVQKIEREARENARTKPQTEGDILGGTTRTTLEEISDQDLKKLSLSELNLLFTEAANIISGSRVQRGTVSGARGETTLFTPYGKTIEEILTAYPSRSEKLKLIARVRRNLRIRQYGGKAKTAGITSNANLRKTASGEKVAVRRGEFKPTNTFDLSAPREMSKADTAKYDVRLAKTYAALDKSLTDLAGINEKVIGPKFQAMADARNAQGAMPKDARNAVYGRAYLRVLTRYGELIKQLDPKSKGGLREIENFNRVVGQLAAAGEAKLLQRLSAMMDAEADAQAKAAARVDPTNVGFLRDRKKRRAAALESVVDLKERIAFSKRMQDKWFTNSYFNNSVAPLMQKLIGYTTRDAAPFIYSVERRGLGYKPTLQEVEDLKFALNRFRLAPTTREDLYKPLKRFFQDFGFKFDESGLIVPMNAQGKFEYSNEADLLRKMRNKASFQNSLSPEQRAAEEARRKSRADKIREENRERRRLMDMTEEQRAAEERGDILKASRDLTKEERALQFQFNTLDQNIPALQRSATALGRLLETPQIPLNLNQAVGIIAANLPRDTAYAGILRKLSEIDFPDTKVFYDFTGKDIRGSAPADYSPRTRDLRINREFFKTYKENGGEVAPVFVRVFVHEAIHAATAGAIRNNPALRKDLVKILSSIRGLAEQQGVSLMDRNKEFYGIRDNNPDEFIAEAFSNVDFQLALRNIEYTKDQSVWQKFLSFIKSVLGMPEAEAQSVFDALVSNADQLFTGEAVRSKGSKQAALQADPTIAGKIGNVLDKVTQSNKITADIRGRASNLLERNKEAGTSALLSALTMEQIRDFYSGGFGVGGGPLNSYMKAFFQRNADNSANLESADKLSRKWTRLSEEYGREAAQTFSQLATESTLYGIFPDRPLTDKTNESIKSAQQKKRYAELSTKFNKMNPKYKQLYNDVQSYYNKTLNEEVSLMTLNALRAAVGSEGGFPYTDKDIAAKKLNTIEGLEKEFGDRLSEEERGVIARIAAIPQSRTGPYFPLMRFGDYVVSSERIVETKTFPDRKDATAFAQRRREDDPTLSVNPPVKSEGGYTVTVFEKEVRIAETRSEAEANRKEMTAEYGKDNVSQVQLKAQLYSRGSSIDSNTGLRTILGKLDGNPAAQAAIKDFYLRSLADGAFRKREIKRANRRGVDYDIQHRTFASYAKSASYFTAQLRFGYKMADALQNMQKYVEKVAKGEEQSTSSAIRLGEVVREIDTRDKLTTTPLEPSKLVRAGTEISQFMMLTSPSYWMINSTQPYMVTLPWLAARSSVGEATAALVGAQKLIASPIVKQMGESVGGLKALWSKAGAERAFTVLEQVEDFIKERGGARSQEYLDMLGRLKRDSIIDLSFVAELRDISEGQNTSTAQRVLDASRIMSHLTEVNNRIMTAIAAYDLYRNKGATAQVAEEFAKQAVSLTQFNYSAGNAPRLFQSRGPLGAMGPLVFQFMKYPQHMYALMIDNMRRAVASGGLDRKIALKTLGGLFATHLAAGGAIGAMLQPIKWAIGLSLVAFGDEDEPYDIKGALSGATMDRLIREGTAEVFGNDLGEIISGGLPRAVGADLSGRMSLGTLYFVDMKTDSPEAALGSLAGSFAGPSVNLGMSFFTGASYMAEGQIAKGIESFLPKMARDALRTIRYSNEGLTDASGKEIIGANKLGPWDLFLQSIGFQPSRVSEAYQRRSVIKGAQAYDDDRRYGLMRRMQRADTPEERSEILQEVTRFNKANPEAGISRSQLIRSVNSFKEREAKMKRFGLDLRDEDVGYAKEGEIYEDE